MTAANGPVAMFLRQCRAVAHLPRVAFFLRFFSLDDVAEGEEEEDNKHSTGSRQGGQALSLGALFHGISVMEMVRKLLGANQAWTFDPFRRHDDLAPVPLACALDVVCNMYNTNEPGGLEVATAGLPPCLMDNEFMGPSLSLDDLVAVLVTDYMAGNAPRHPVHFPRHTMDGRLTPLLSATAFLSQLKEKPRRLASLSPRRR
jgi:hypothetical protein